MGNRLSKTEFMANAKPFKLDVNGTDLVAEPKIFSRGISFGWVSRKKTNVEIDGKKVTIQINVNFIVLSKKGEEVEEVEDPGFDEE